MPTAGYLGRNYLSADAASVGRVERVPQHT
jgi:hypothetical protein